MAGRRRTKELLVVDAGVGEIAVIPTVNHALGALLPALPLTTGKVPAVLSKC